MKFYLTEPERDLTSSHGSFTRFSKSRQRSEALRQRTHRRTGAGKVVEESKGRFHGRARRSRVAKRSRGGGCASRQRNFRARLGKDVSRHERGNHHVLRRWVSLENSFAEMHSLR